MAVVVMLGSKLFQVSLLDRGYSALNRVRWPLALLLCYALVIGVQTMAIGAHREMTANDGLWPYITEIFTRQSFGCFPR
ncbi:MAG: hypothetical protein IPJ18_16055 [Betaproteobacteria bacterium]|nr:hypothetical protein [Betaproteobacteria bacterium]